MGVATKQAADPSIGELMSKLSSQVSRLIRDDLRLAEKKLQQSAEHAGIAGLISVAGLLASLARWLSSPQRWPPLSLVLAVWAALIAAPCCSSRPASAIFRPKPNAREMSWATLSEYFGRWLGGLFEQRGCPWGLWTDDA
jgi:hypothetical protein